MTTVNCVLPKRYAVVPLKLLKWIHSFVGNWGFSIIIITFIVRGIMYPLTKAQYTSSSNSAV